MSSNSNFMSPIKSSLSVLFKWAIFALAIVILLKIISIFVPSLSQDNLKKYLGGNNNEKGSSWFNLPYPGSYSGTFNIMNKNGFKYEPIEVQTLSSSSTQNTESYIYVESEYIKNQDYNNQNKNNNYGEYNTDWKNNSNATNWNEAETDWKKGQTDWKNIPNATDWKKDQTDWKKQQTDWSIKSI